MERYFFANFCDCARMSAGCVEKPGSGVVSFRAVEPISFTAEESSHSGSRFAGISRRPLVFLSGLVLLISAGLLVYSQTMSFVWDEGFHLLAAQLITRGKIPYIDFCFPQTPLNAYWNAAWMQVFGDGWRITHVVAALEVSGAVYLTAEFVLSRLPVRNWRLPCACVVACFVGLNSVVMMFGTVAQAYGIGMLLTVAAFRVSLRAVGRNGWWLALVAGFLAGAAADSTLLTAPVVPIVLFWMFVYNRVGNRWAKAAAFLAGVLIAFAPVFWLFGKGPRQTLFNVLQYQAIYRRVKWTGATPHDVDVLSAWLDSSQTLLMAALALAGTLYVRAKSTWDRIVRAEFYLCAWLAITLTVYIATAHPTFERYFIFVVPFASALAAVGLYSAGSRLHGLDRPLRDPLLVSVVVTLALGRGLFKDRDAVKWNEYEDIARKIDQVTPPNGKLYADEQVYFLTKRPPPSGMEFSYSHQLELPAPREALLHLISQKELDAQAKAGKFDTAESCNDDRIDEMKLPSLYAHKADIGDCSIFWGKRQPAGHK